MSRIHRKGRLSAGISAVTLATSLVLATPAFAQSEVSNIQGHVEGARVGATVVATDTNTGQRSTGTIDASGNYSIFGLRPSTYSVAVEGQPAQQTTLLVGQTATLDFVPATSTAAIPGQGGSIVVRGRRIAQPVQAQTVATNVTSAQIENLPQNQRNFLSFAALAPGVNVPPGGTAQIQAGATSASNVNVLLDGLSFKNPINHGGVFGQNFGLGNPFPQLAVQEYQVQTQNFGAETGQAGSAVVTAITKTGGNKFHGSAFIDWQPKSFIGQPYFDKKAGVKKPNYDRKQFGGELGGPIIPGKLTFYVAGEGTIEKLPATFGTLPVNNNLPTSITSQILTSRNFDFKQGLYFGKLTFFATDADTINLSAFVRRENNLSDIDANASASHGRTILTHQNRYQLQWRHTAGNFTNLLNASYDKGTQQTPSVGTGPEYVVSNAFANAATCNGLFTGANLTSCQTTAGGAPFDALAQLGAHFFTQGDSEKIWTVRDDATWRHGAHTIRAGAQLALLDLSRSVSDHFNGSYYFYNPGPNGTLDQSSPYGARINIAPTPDVSAKDTQIGVYLQDEWKPDQHWTVNAGLRWDFESNANNNKYVTPAAIAAALRAYPGWAARGINPEDYISTGDNRKPQYNEFQPRLGVSYDVKGDRDLVLFGGAGRYYDRSLFIEGVIETLTNSNNVVTYNFNGACAGAAKPAYCTDPNALRTFLQGQGTGGSVFVLNNKTKMPYSDQFDVGLRKRFGEITTSLTFSHIRSHNIFQYVRSNFYSNGWYTRNLIRDANGNVTGCTDGGDTWIIDLTPGTNYAACPATNGQLTGYSGKLDRGSNRGKASYNALYLTAEKPFTDRSTWGFTTALTIQRARTNVAQELNSDEFYNGPAVDVYGTDYVNGVEKWRLVTAGNYRAPWGIVLSGQLTLSSGPSFGNIIFGNAPDGACCYANMGGVFFPHKTFGYKRLDLRVGKVFKLPWGHELEANFQAFNVFNWLNRTYSSWGAGSGANPPLVENGQVGNDARSFQAGLRYRF
ncbi:TonB-dependent receptor [Sphingomonas ginkgonis]|uniref:TonB-dependent receptor n=1 Tax=Sphingomonas ginkgonis TaxID=2315330 RepID=A0A429V7C7_9SPHN|nr:TonB-dependent receptor [Sphingomonas ginkgonis]RST29853.1 TonB-dependent receptor [Sphingomonas ginkgonis]